MPARPGPPELVVIGAEHCGTRALHTYLDRHPQIAVAGWGTDFFFGPGRGSDGGNVSTMLSLPPHAVAGGRAGQWIRGPEWYVSRFDPAATVRGDVSPGYSEPCHPRVAERMSALLPHARLVLMVRDPVDRAVADWEQRVRAGIEHRPVEEAVLDPESPYLARSRYHERLLPFLRHYPRQQLRIVVQERLLADRPGQLRRIYRHVGVDPDWWDPSPPAWVHDGAPLRGRVPRRVRTSVWEAVGDDVSRLRELMADPLLEWRRTEGPTRAGVSGAGTSAPGGSRLAS